MKSFLKVNAHRTSFDLKQFDFFPNSDKLLLSLSLRVNAGSHNIGVAVATPHGLAVPNIKKVHSLSVLEVRSSLELHFRVSYENFSSGNNALSVSLSSFWTPSYSHTRLSISALLCLLFPLYISLLSPFLYFVSLSSLFSIPSHCLFLSLIPSFASLALCIL